MKRQAFKRAAVNSQLCRLLLIGPPGLNTSIFVTVLGPIWPPGMSHRAKVFGRCEVKSGITPVDCLVSEVMNQEPYKSAHRVFWIMDNCSAHRGQKAVDRLRSKWPNALLIHTPIHASWLNQIEIYFSIVQRKVLTPNDFSSLGELEQRLLAFQHRYERTASPFQWTFTRSDLQTLLAKIGPKRLAPAA